MSDLQTRGTLLRRTALSTAALTAMLPAAPVLAAAPSRRNDIAILNYLLGLEQLELAFFAGAVKADGVKGAAKDAATLFFSHETQHITALKAAIRAKRGKANANRGYDFRGTNEETGAFLGTAFAIENLVVNAYLGQLTNVEDRGLLSALGAIATVEARHAAGVSRAADDKPFNLGGVGGSLAPNGPFDDRYSMARVNEEIAAAGFVV